MFKKNTEKKSTRGRHFNIESPIGSSRYFFIGLLLTVLLLSFWIIKPFISYVFLAFLLSYVFHPMYEKVRIKLKSPALSASIIISIVLLLLIIPMFLIVTQFVVQATSVYSSIETFSLEGLSSLILDHTGFSLDVGAFLQSSIGQLRTYILSASINLLGSLTEVAIGLFIMFFLIFYLFIDGRGFLAYVKAVLPLKKNHVNTLLHEVKDVTYAVLYGQILAAFVQGFVGGIGFFVFGVSNPIFWGFIMAILSLLPFIGAAIVWIPVTLLLLGQGYYFAGFGLLIYCALIVSNIDNVIKPKLIGRKADIHPAVVVLGVFGGLSAFGFVGLFAGPLLLSLGLILIKFYREEE